MLTMLSCVLVKKSLINNCEDNANFVLIANNKYTVFKFVNINYAVI